ncbi:carbon-nitrogen hydrolase family protein [Pseudomonas cavernicola]|uniref:Carbon-nitrogen hydrolase family protein n=1 Tax=Pseudomonas cavernicola TaxID=2320866 RepID=A0A418X965_9PSED|nr:carbon-nitrogen hydrolase family protein [Pseudomonas cavernicola]RJG09026.1 carbon-nitrogen hydrolase family protein [Pseudomonas cavernicola]
MKIALCQLNSGQDRQANIAAALKGLDEAGAKGARLAMLPECIDYMGPIEGVKENSEPFNGPSVEAFAAKAKEHQMWVLAGTLRTTDGIDARCSNTAYLITPEGKIASFYNKVHMFDVKIKGQVDFLESAVVKPGSSVGFSAIDDIPVGISICYDLRFPELFRAQALMGAKILFLPAAFTMFTGKDHWEVLLRARAIENQCFVVATGQWGTHAPGITSYGRSLVVDPWGTVIACAPDGVNTTVVDLPMGRIEDVRNSLPSLANRKPEVYKDALL